MIHSLFKAPLDLVLILLISSALIVLSGCMPKALKNERQYLNSYYQNHTKPISQQTQLEMGQLNWVEVGNHDKSTIIFIHGTPGSWSFFSSFLHHQKLLDNAHIIAIDRPGWGLSQFNDKTQRSYTLSEQSKFLGQWLCEIAEKSPDKQVLLIGHSYGATLAPKMAMDYPDCVSALLLLAGPADPELSKPRWYNRITNTTVFGRLVRKIAPELKYSNKEMMNLSSDLKLIEDQWQNLIQPTIVMQGRKDFLVNHKNADFIEEHLINAPLNVIRKPKQGHFVLFENKELVVDEALKLLRVDN